MTCKRPSIIKRSRANRRLWRMSQPTLKRPLNTGTGESCWLCHDPQYLYLKSQMHLMGPRKRYLENQSWRVEKETRLERLSHFCGLFAFFSMFLVLVFLVYYFSGSQPPANKRQTGKNLQKSQVTYICSHTTLSYLPKIWCELHHLFSWYLMPGLCTVSQDWH